jgi:hypothetical protein
LREKKRNKVGYFAYASKTFVVYFKIDVGDRYNFNKDSTNAKNERIYLSKCIEIILSSLH